MTTKQYLNRAYHLNNLIDSKLAELDKLKDLRFNISGNTSGVAVQASKETTEAKYASVILRIAEYEDYINNEINNLIEIKSEISAVISKLEDNSEKAVLSYRFLNYYKFEKIAEEMNYSLRQTYRVYNAALNHIEDVTKCH